MQWAAQARRVSSPGHLGTGTVRGVILTVARLVAETSTDATADANGLVEACGVQPRTVCEAAWNLTHNRFLTHTITWVVTRPLSALVVFIIAALVNRWLRRAATALITRVTTPTKLTATALEGLGVITGPDPRDATRTRTLCAVARATISAFVWSLATLIILGLFNIELAPLIAGAGIAGIAIGLGAQSLVRDCIAGFFILLEDQCGVGDDIDISTVSGKVEGLTMRATTIRAADGTLWTVPNGAILRIGNQSRAWAQANVDVLVSPERDLQRATELAEQAVQAVAAEDDIAGVLLREPQVLGVEKVDQNGSVLRLAVRTKPGEQARVARRMRYAIAAALAADDPAPDPGADPA